MPVTLALSDRAKAEIIALRAEFAGRLESRKMLHLPPGVLTPLSEEYEKRLKAILRSGMTETRNDRPVRVKCPKCARESTIAGDVQRWSCVCSRDEHFAFQTYVEV